ncbi:hypothetical protein [Sorangium cellulosum]|nr:hypothetical protein [Sorangium cellulosum]
MVGPATRFPLLETLRGTTAERALLAVADWRDARAAIERPERLERDGLLA